MDETIEKTEQKIKEETPNSKRSSRTLWKRIGLCFGTFLLFLVVTVICACNLLLNGPSESMRNALVLSAKQASATKWIPELFLSDELVREIEAGGLAIQYDTVSMDEITAAGNEAAAKH